MKRYAIWNKIDPIITPSGAVFTAEQWIEKYPVAALPAITVICGAGETNGSFFGTLGQLTQFYENQGVDFSACTTAEEKLALMEAFDQAQEDETKAVAEATKAQEEMNAMSLASIAASMEYQNMLTLDDVEE